MGFAIILFIVWVSLPLYLQEEGNTVNKKLGRLFWPGLWIYFGVMAAFVAGAVLDGRYLLAGIEAAVTAVLIAVYILLRNRRRREVHSFVRSVFPAGSVASTADAPFPMVLIRIGDGSILWANDRFSDVTGYQHKYLEQPIHEVLPDVPIDWLVAGKNEYPYGVTLGNRRYRVYGTVVRADDPEASVLGMLYFNDLTELYQVRDEYIRSRPVTAIILVDNYEELTKNLAEGDISTLNAKINDVIAQWCEDYHALLRRLERNRYLLVFEKRDLNRATEEKFSLLDKIHAVENPTGLAASISIGIGVDAVSFEESFCLFVH